MKYQFIITSDVITALAKRGDKLNGRIESFSKLIHSGSIDCWTTILEISSAINNSTSDTKASINEIVKNFQIFAVPSLLMKNALENGDDDINTELLVEAGNAYLPSPVFVSENPAFPSDNLLVLKPCDVKEWIENSKNDEPADMPFIDLAHQQRKIFSKIESRIHTVLCHGKYIMGPEIEELETKLAEFVGVKHAISCSSGTDALLMALMADGVGRGDAVFTTTFTFIATAEVIAMLGAVPVFVDIDPKTFNIDPVKLEEAIAGVKESGRLKAKSIIPVDLFGLPADYDKIMSIAKKYGLSVLEDTAQGLGGIYKDRKSGSLAHMSATSFFPAKPLGGYGDGGAIFTDDDELADKLTSIRIHGMGKERYNNIRIGLNGRLDTLQATILIPKLEIFPEEIKARQKVAKQYTERLKELLVTPFIPDGYESAWAQYSVLTKNREALQAGLKNKGIPTMVYYPKPLHLQDAFKYLNYKPGDFPLSEKISKEIVSLPMHPYLTEDEIEKITNIIFGLLR